jgi:hypothetical protein
VLHDDARFSLEQAVRAHERMTGRALQLAAVNGAVIALVVDAVDGPTPLTLEPVSVVGAGVGVLVLSLVLAVLSSIPISADTGIGRGTVEDVESSRLEEETYIHWVVSNGYVPWTEQTSRVAEWKGIALTVALVLFFVGVVVILVGTLIS